MATGGLVESHGGYLCRYEDVDVAWLQLVAAQALTDDGVNPADVGLQITVLGGPQIVRFSFDGAFTYGRTGARWYLSHHALARKLSEHLRMTVHSYVYDSDEMEQVVAFGDGRRVGGDTLRYDDCDMPEDEGDDDRAFAKLAATWPLGHLARVLGIAREDLIRIPRRPMALLELGKPAAPQALWRLLPESVRTRRSIELYAP